MSTLPPGPGLSGLFDAEVDPASWESLALSEQQLREFDEKGYLAGVRILSPAECDHLAAEVRSLLDPAHPQGAGPLWYVFNPLVSAGGWRLSLALHDLPWCPQLRIAAYQLLGGPPRFLHDQIFCKPPRHRGPSWFGFHQDLFYWSWTSPMAHLTCWIALDDTTTANGCLQYVPGSHRWGLLPPIPAGAEPSLTNVAAVLSPEQQRALYEADKIELKRGYASFHHPLMLHGSDTNTTTRPRRAAVVNTILDGVTSNCEAQPASLGAFPFIPQGRPMGRSSHENDRMYPLLLGPGGSPAALGPGPEVLSRIPRLRALSPLPASLL